MNEMRDPDVVFSAWLDEGPTELPNGTRRAIVAALPTTPQARRGSFAPGRFPMISLTRFATIATVLVVALGAAIYILRPAGSTVSSPPTSSPAQSTAGSPLAPSPRASESAGLRTPSPLRGRATDFPVAFTYTLPADAGLVVDYHDPYADSYQFRHPSGADTYDRGVIVRAISGGRTDPCSAGATRLGLANPDAFVAYFRTVPTMEIRNVTDVSVDGYPAKQMTLHFLAPTPACPDVYLWADEGSITQNAGRDDARITVFDVATHHITVLTMGPASFLPTADEFIASLKFEVPAPSASAP
jgi:hypothetical protein